MGGKQDNRKDSFIIKMFGEFSIQYGSHIVTDDIGRVKKVWMLIEYLIANREKSISQEKLIEVLWSEEECENPTGALKNLVYRARNVLKKLGERVGQEAIQYVRSTYAWNNLIPCHVDIEEFEEMCLQASSRELDIDSRIACYQRAIELYQGEFLPKSSYADWVVAKNAHYTTAYNDCVLQAAALLEQEERYEEIINLCEQAVAFNPYEERIHCRLLAAYAKIGQYNKAASHYEFVTKLFYKEFGVSLSEETRKLYKAIAKDMHSLEMDLKVIRDDLKEASTPGRGAYYCTDYDVFKSIYQVQARLIMRTGFSIHIGLITMTDRRGSVPPASVVQPMMELLRESVTGSLRKGDVVWRYNSAQLVIMLPMTTYESAEMVMNRLLLNFRKVNKRSDIELRTMLCVVEPVEQQGGFCRS